MGWLSQGADLEQPACARIVVTAMKQSARDEKFPELSPLQNEVQRLRGLESSYGAISREFCAPMLII